VFEQNQEFYHAVGQQRSQLLSLDKPHHLLILTFHIYFIKNLFCQKNFTSCRHRLGGRKKSQQYDCKRLNIITMQHHNSKAWGIVPVYDKGVSENFEPPNNLPLNQFFCYNTVSSTQTNNYGVYIVSGILPNTLFALS
jgi:hypothetical protein